MNKPCVLFAAGEYYGNETLLAGDLFVVTADGGYAAARRFGLVPDLHVGDFDSFPGEVEAKQTISLKPEKDDTDTMSAVKAALERGCRDFLILGGTGGRTAHTLANIQTLAFLASRGCRARMVGNHEIFACVQNGAIRFDASSRGYVSVFSLADVSAGVRETGLKYEVSDFTMTNRYPMGVSNEFTGAPAEIGVGDGALLVVYTDKAMERSEP